MIRKYIEKIGENKNIEDMYKLGDMLADLIYDTKESHPDIYKKYKNKLMGMAYGYKFDKEMAHEIVENMKPLGEYWDLKTIESVKNQNNLNLDLYEFYVVMNAMANDYNQVISLDDVETYVKMSEAFINDEDAKEHKVWRYFTKIVK